MVWVCQVFPQQSCSRDRSSNQLSTAVENWHKQHILPYTADPLGGTGNMITAHGQVKNSFLLPSQALW